jgi:uncharacterized small protein (DUF1192 family)
MAFDPFSDERVRPALKGHELGEDLSSLSIEELDERITVLEREIGRLREARDSKENTRAAASAFFRIEAARS